ncbi:unnamed protein product [Clavelina lepadiformis]|uniref:Uncharacterized protein n=1 Tax=Clavelina lepadiformis TaxID=159417 RepID=A0ABP0F9Y6_CLALP
MKNNAKGIKLKIEQLQKEVLPRLISKGTRFQKNLILARVFQEKRLKQRKITCMQKQLIQLLLQQTCRLSCLWMILQFEKSQMSVLSKTMQTFGTILKNYLEAVKHSIQNLQSVKANAVNHSKDPKAVIDKRDNVMLALHNALVLDTEEYSMFHTFPTACKAAVDLQQKLSSLDVEHDRDASKTSVQQLVYSLLQFYWKHSNVIKNEEKVLLSSKELSTAIKGVSEDVKSMKSNVPLLLAKVDKKRGYLEHNSNAVVTKKLWLDFVLDCIT